jgi:hypothetical protein
MLLFAGKTSAHFSPAEECAWGSELAVAWQCCPAFEHLPVATHELVGSTIFTLVTMN